MSRARTCGRPWAHPRSRGEHQRISAVQVRPAGSSPLTRGAPRDYPARRRTVGLIPAHAGSTLQPNGPRGADTAHPRSRGEHETGGGVGRPNSGSSPLTRGARAGDPRRLIAERLIPAHAGSTCFSNPLISRTAAHPRSRGEHDHVERVAHHLQGSSPLTRGALPGQPSIDVRIGLIPAHAGSTSWYPIASWLSRAHPRSRGEHRLDDGHRRLDLGLIPAHAGSTTMNETNRTIRKAHPRSRGEHRSIRLRPWLGFGSSPLTRGARLRTRPGRCPRGLIPAHAGSTSGPRIERHFSTAHPRSRGEHELG